MLTPCPVCQRPVPLEAHACPECGTPINVAPSTADSLPPVVGSPDEAVPATAKVYVYTGTPAADARGGRVLYSDIQPVWQYVLLQFCTLGFYDLAWFYRTWSLLRERHRLHISPGARTLFAGFFVVHLSREIYKLAAESGHKPKWSPVAVGCGFVLCSIIGSFLRRQDSMLTFGLALLFFTASVRIRVPLVRSLNDFWRHEQPDLPVRTRLSGGAWVIVVIGGLFWIVSLLGLIAEQSGLLGPG